MKGRDFNTKGLDAITGTNVCSLTLHGVYIPACLPMNFVRPDVGAGASLRYIFAALRSLTNVPVRRLNNQILMEIKLSKQFEDSVYLLTKLFIPIGLLFRNLMYNRSL